MTRRQLRWVLPVLVCMSGCASPHTSFDGHTLEEYRGIWQMQAAEDRALQWLTEGAVTVAPDGSVVLPDDARIAAKDGKAHLLGASSATSGFLLLRYSSRQVTLASLYSARPLQLNDRLEVPAMGTWTVSVMINSRPGWYCVAQERGRRS